MPEFSRLGVSISYNGKGFADADTFADDSGDIISSVVNSPNTSGYRSWGLYAAWLAVCCATFSRPLVTLFHYARDNDNASHLLLIPFIVAWLIYEGRHKVVSGNFDLLPCLWFALPAVFLSLLALGNTFSDNTVSLAIYALALVLFFIAGFVAIFGRASAREMAFPLGFLVFLIPLPSPLLERAIYALQVGSAAVAEIIFDATGVPVLRQGFVFHLPKMSIEVAKECSGIRSSMALLILAVLVSQFAFSKFWKKTLFVSAGLLVMIVKNGVRIATLTILANYVDPDFLYGKLHRQGGVVFFLIGLALLVPLYWKLRKDEGPLVMVPGK